MTDNEESMALAIEELLGYSASVERTDQQQPGNSDEVTYSVDPSCRCSTRPGLSLSIELSMLAIDTL